ncbi:MAG: S1C family serine protease, partial [bacterium]
MKQKPTQLIIALALFCGIISNTPPLFAQNASQKKSIDNLVKISTAFQTLAEYVRPGVVQIFAEGYVPGRGIVASTSGLVEKQEGSGSGVILDPNGYIVTNAHVVSGASRVRVMLPASAEVLGERSSILKPLGRMVGAQVVGIDQETDLAVLKIADTGLYALQLADSDELQQGQVVLAFGSPFGLENSVSMGVVSSTARQLRPEDPMVYLQTDATINPGNSGGPLVNVEGKVVGINTMIFSQSGGSEGIGFAAPSNIVRNVYHQIRTQGYVQRGEIGVYVQTVSPTMSHGLNLPKDWGVIVSDVYPRSPASAAGLKVGDLILSLNSKPMENARQFNVNLYRRQIGEQVNLKVLRGSESRVYRVTVAERRNDPGRLQAFVSPEKNLIEKLGILGLDLDDSVRSMLRPLRQRYGVVV